MDRRVTSPSWGPSPPCKQALSCFTRNYRTTVKGHKYSSLSYKMREIFTLVVHNINSENSMQGARLAKGGEIGKKKKQSNIRPRVRKNCIVSERKGIRAVCVLSPHPFSEN